MLAALLVRCTAGRQTRAGVLGEAVDEEKSGWEQSTGHRNKEQRALLLGAPGLTTRSKDATSSGLCLFLPQQ